MNPYKKPRKPPKPAKPKPPPQPKPQPKQKPEPPMSANTHLKELSDALDGGWGRIDDPGEGNLLKFTAGIGYLNATSGTRKLPTKPEGVIVIAKATGDLDLTTAAGAHVATATASRMAVCISQGAGAWEQIGAGSAPDPLNDILTATALQTALDEDKENGIPLRLKTGEIVCTSTRDIDGDSVGCLLEGYGGVMAEAAANTRQFSALRRSGDFAGEPLLKLKRAFVTLRNFSLFGDSAAAIDSGTYTDGELALLITRDTNVGTGKSIIEGLVIDGWTVGVQVGSAAGEFNCDECLWIYPVWWRCDTAYTQTSQHSLGHLLLHPHFNLVDTCCEIKGGGDLKIIGGTFTQARNVATDAAVIRYRNDTVGEFGLNAGAVLVEGIKIDKQCRGVMLLDMEAVAVGNYQPTVRFNTPQIPWDAGWSNSWGGPLLNLSGAGHYHIDGATVLYPDAVKWSLGAGVNCHVTIENCNYCVGGTTWEDFFDTAGSTGSLMQIEFRNNYDGNGNRIPDYSSADVANVTAAADPGAAIPIAAKHVTVTSASANNIVVLPPPVIGKIVTGYVGANGCEFYADSGVATTINGVTCSATNEAAMPANSLWRAQCVSSGAWILTYTTSAGAAGATITPDAR